MKPSRSTKAVWIAALLFGTVLLPRVCFGEDLDLDASAETAVEPDPSPGDLRRRIDELTAREPTVAQVRQAAVEHAGLARDPRRSWAARARLAGLLPELTTRVTRSQDRDEGVDTDGDGSTHDRSLDVGDQVVLELRATWDLRRLVFDPVEIRAAREGLRIVAERQHLELEVTRLYYQRRRAQIEWIASPPTSALDMTRRMIEMDELTANLDALTGGWLSREIARMEAE
jgi:hypothetical protein